MSDVTTLKGLINQEIILKTNERFGEVKGTVVSVNAAGTHAAITFISFGSAYSITVPVEWIYTKNTEGKALPIKAGVAVTAVIETPEVATRRAVLLDINETAVLVKQGARTLVVPFSRIKDIIIPREKEEGSARKAPGRKPALAVAKAPAKAPAPTGRLARAVAPAVPGRRQAA